MSKNRLIKSVSLLSLLAICVVNGMDVDKPTSATSSAAMKVDVVGESAKDSQSFLSVLPKDVRGHLSRFAQDTNEMEKIIRNTQTLEQLMRNSQATSLHFDPSIISNLIRPKFSNQLNEYHHYEGIGFDYGGERLTSLGMAARLGNASLVQALIKAGADIQEGEDMKRSPLYLAAMQGHLPVVRLLLSLRANVNQADNVDTTPLFAAAENGHLDVVQALIAAGADVNIPQEQPPLINAISNKKNSLEVVKLLLQAGANPNAQLDSLSSLYFAVKQGDEAIVDLLIKYGAHPQLTDTEKHFLRSTLEQAKREGNQKMIELLNKYGVQ